MPSLFLLIQSIIHTHTHTQNTFTWKLTPSTFVCCYYCVCSPTSLFLSCLLPLFVINSPMMTNKCQQLFSNFEQGKNQLFQYTKNTAASTKTFVLHTDSAVDESSSVTEQQANKERGSERDFQQSRELYFYLAERIFVSNITVMLS